MTTTVDEVVDDLSRRELSRQQERLEEVPESVAADAFRGLDEEHQGMLLGALAEERRATLFADLSPDDRARILSTVDESLVASLLGSLDVGERRLTEQLLRYPHESVGRMMTPRYLALAPDQTRGEALADVRACDGTIDTVYTLPVVESDRLVGVVQLRDLLCADDRATAADLMAPPEPVLHPEQDQEVASRLMLATEALAIPVVDDDRRLLGLVTVDDAMEVLTLEEAEDVSRSSAAEPLRQPYLSASLARLARSRALWLLVLALAATLTVNVLELFEAELERIVSLALFIPLLIGTGGNAGAQATTTVVRAMAVGGVEFRDLPKVAWREIRVGLLLGGLLGVLAIVPVMLIYEPRMAAVVSLTLVSICTIATAVGSVLPVVAGRLGLDPAVVSAPFITTLVDASGLLVYFLYAKTVFGI